MADGYGIYHEFDYGDRHLERGEYVQIETGMMKNDQSLINIGYIKLHDGKDLISCLRCGKKFVASSFIRYHEEQCPIEPGISIPAEPVPVGADAATEPSLAELRSQTLAKS
ncbi:hypothetical protein LCGC14_0448570 [marine sediment metagenome]|uniref:C2H2-type domain-containing protein n=1 Tax=marine sediment metagenome TaxID=412755 RepID=A0A0F9V544_9ZZZZ